MHQINLNILSFLRTQSLYKHEPFFQTWGLTDLLSNHFHHRQKLLWLSDLLWWWLCHLLEWNMRGWNNLFFLDEMTWWLHNVLCIIFHAFILRCLHCLMFKTEWCFNCPIRFYKIRSPFIAGTSYKKGPSPTFWCPGGVVVPACWERMALDPGSIV